VTAAAEEQKVLLETEFGIPRSRIFSSNDASFAQNILQSTNTGGVDVVVNFVSDDLFSESLKCIAEGGSMLDLSPRDSTSHEKLDRGLPGGNQSFYRFDMVTLLQQKPLMAQRSVNHMFIFRSPVTLLKKSVR
jgi:NADPH:quinone reductase-like Zn-dependent oxidoreductase